MYIYVAKSRKLRNKLSIYVKTKYNKEHLKIIESFSGNYYHRKENLWEMQYKNFKALIEKCRYIDITIGDLPDELEDYLNKLDAYEEPDRDYNSKTTPYEHQVFSFDYASDHAKFLLADEQGLGKTKQSLDIAVSRKDKMRHCLIVCGVNGLKWNWYNEITVHTSEAGHILGMTTTSKGKQVIGSVEDRLEDLKSVHDEFFLITNIETLRDKNIQRQIKKMCDSGVIGMTIIDEIHKCKNPSSTQGKAIHCCTSYYKLALTGTPIMNNAIDLYNILKWLEVENHNLTQFKDFYCVMGGFGGYEIIGYRHMDILQEVLDDCMLRRTKEQVLDLPPKIHTDDFIEMTEEQDKLYKEVLQGIQDNIDKVMLLPNPLVELIRLRQVTSYPGIVSSTITFSVKLNRMLEIVEECVDNGEKVIVFSNWTKVINPAYELLCKHNFNPALVTGEVKDTNKEQTKFKTDESCKVILGTISCLGTGFTLTEASTVIFLDEPYTRAAKDQAEDRCHRIGTKGTVNIITLLCKNTIDERIHHLITKKGELSDAIVDKKDFNYLLS